MTSVTNPTNSNPQTSSPNPNYGGSDVRVSFENLYAVGGGPSNPTDRLAALKNKLNKSYYASPSLPAESKVLETTPDQPSDGIFMQQKFSGLGSLGDILPPAELTEILGTSNAPLSQAKESDFQSIPSISTTRDQVIAPIPEVPEIQKDLPINEISNSKTGTHPPATLPNTVPKPTLNTATPTASLESNVGNSNPALETPTPLTYNDLLSVIGNKQKPNKIPQDFLAKLSQMPSN